MPETGPLLIDTHTRQNLAQFDTAPLGLNSVEVTRWSAQLVDPACERDYRLDRFDADRRRVMLLLVLGLTGNFLNFLLELYTFNDGRTDAYALIAVVGVNVLPVLGLIFAARVRSPSALETLVIIAISIGMVTRLGLLTLHPDLGAMWPALMIGIVFVLYLFLPIRLTASVALALAFSCVAPACWIWAQASLLPVDQFGRGLICVVLANALGFAAANSMQRSQRTQFAQRLVLQQLLSTDAMTGIANRRRFDAALDREWRRCRRTNAALSVLMIDVDHFKAYNDHCGHPQGDACLRQVAQILVEAVGRPGDLAARYGGEEFVCLLPEVSAAGALTVAERLTAALRRANIVHPRSPAGPRLTISIGVATVEMLTGEAERLVEFADQLLYAAKRAGRNQIKAGQLVPERETRAA